MSCSIVHQYVTHSQRDSESTKISVMKTEIAVLSWHTDYWRIFTIARLRIMRNRMDRPHDVTSLLDMSPVPLSMWVHALAARYATPVMLIVRWMLWWWSVCDFTLLLLYRLGRPLMMITKNFSPRPQFCSVLSESFFVALYNQDEKICLIFLFKMIFGWAGAKHRVWGWHQPLAEASGVTRRVLEKPLSPEGNTH